jgi:DNA-binding MarR family transcriptional regulator
VKEQVFFKELEESKMMAKSTLSKHLRELVKEGLLRKTISKTRALGSHCVVYVITAKGKRELRNSRSRELRYLPFEY